MTVLKVIEGGGVPPDFPRLPSPEAARSAILDRVAAAIYASDDPLPEYMDWDSFKARAAADRQVAYEVAQYQRQARLAIQAMKPSVEDDNDIEVGCGAWAASTTGQPPSVVIMCTEAWIGEVLK